MHSRMFTADGTADSPSSARTRKGPGRGPVPITHYELSTSGKRRNPLGHDGPVGADQLLTRTLDVADSKLDRTFVSPASVKYACTRMSYSVPEVNDGM